MSRSVQLLPIEAPSVAFQQEVASSLVLKKAAEAPGTVRQTVELFHQLGKVEALLAHPPAHLIRSFPAAYQAQISALLDGYQQAVDTLHPTLTRLLAGTSSSSCLAVTQAEAKRLENAVVRLTEGVTQLEEVTGWLEKSFDLRELNSVISTLFVLASLLYAVISLVGMLLALAFPPLLTPLVSLTFACAQAVHHLTNKFYEIKKQHVLSEWKQYEKPLSDFAFHLQKIKDSTMFSLIHDQGQKVQQLERLVQLMQQRLETLERQQGVDEAFQGRETTASTAPITGIVLAPTASPAADFEDAARNFVNARFAEGLSYQQIRQAGLNQLATAIAHHQAGRDQQQQQQQDNLAAIRSGH